MCQKPMNGIELFSGIGLPELFIVCGLICLSYLFRLRDFSLRFSQVVIATTLEECRDVAIALKRKCAAYPAVGFDCEWVTVGSTRGRVALMQLATRDGFCALVRLCQVLEDGTAHIPSELKEFLEDPSIFKVGVVPSDDAKYLMNDYGIIVRGCLDLRHLVLRNGGISHGGLRGLAFDVLGVTMDKSWYIRCSNWEDKVLSERQIDYAANDAWFAVKIFEVLTLGKLKLADCRPFSCFKLNWLRWMKISPFSFPLEDYVDVKFHKKTNVSNNCNVDSQLSSVSPESFKPKPTKAPRLVPRGFCARQKPLYHNCFLQAPDGAILCTCDRNKAMWYVSKNLAEVITNEPLTVRLKFEPSGRAVGSVGQYYIQKKSNCCVVCGNTDNCIRKIVVPHEYRKHFPNVMKDHSSHDVLLLCVHCHLRSNGYDLALKCKLSDLCNAPLVQGGNSKFNVNRERSSVKAAARALLRSCDNIPLERQQTLRSTVQNFYKVSELTDSILKEAAALDTHTKNDNYDPHGIKVVQYFSIESNGGLVKLEQMWREHFLQTMRPKHMPNLWSVTHTQDRLAIRATENRVLADELSVAGMKDCISLLDVEKMSTEQKKP